MFGQPSPFGGQGGGSPFGAAPAAATSFGASGTGPFGGGGGSSGAGGPLGGAGGGGGPFGGSGSGAFGGGGSAVFGSAAARAGGGRSAFGADDGGGGGAFGGMGGGKPAFGADDGGGKSSLFGSSADTAGPFGSGGGAGAFGGASSDSGGPRGKSSGRGGKSGKGSSKGGKSDGKAFGGFGKGGKGDGKDAFGSAHDGSDVGPFGGGGGSSKRAPSPPPGNFGPGSSKRPPSPPPGDFYGQGEIFRPPSQSGGQDRGSKSFGHDDRDANPPKPKEDPWTKSGDPWQAGKSRAADEGWQKSQNSSWNSSWDHDSWSDYKSKRSDGDEGDQRDKWRSRSSEENAGWGRKRSSWGREEEAEEESSWKTDGKRSTSWENSKSDSWRDESRGRGKSWEGSEGRWGQSNTDQWTKDSSDHWKNAPDWKNESAQGKSKGKKGSKDGSKGGKGDKGGKKGEDGAKGGKSGNWNVWVPGQASSGPLVKAAPAALRTGKIVLTPAPAAKESDAGKGKGKTPKFNNMVWTPKPVEPGHLPEPQAAKAEVRRDLPSLDEIIGNEEEQEALEEEAWDECGEEEEKDDDDVVEVKDEDEDNEEPPSPCSENAVGFGGQEDEDYGEGEEEEYPEDDEDEPEEQEEEGSGKVIIGFDGKPVPQGGFKAAPPPVVQLSKPATVKASLAPAPTVKVQKKEQVFGNLVAPSAGTSTALADAARAFLAKPDCSPFAQAGRSFGGEKGMVGTLALFCSEKEMEDRKGSRQLDIFEMAAGSSFVTPLLNSSLALKKYQRSSADKVYLPEDIRTVEACTLALNYLMTTVIHHDVLRPEGLSELARDANYWQVYSFMRDRTRAVRVDLHVQQPWSANTRAYIMTHEICLRFEVLSMYVLTTKPEYLEKYDEKMAHKACSQIMEPLLNAYVLARSRAEAGELAYISPSEPAIRSYTILLLLVGADENEVFSHLQALSKELLKTPQILWATKVATAYAIGEYGIFLRLWKTADFLSMAILTPLVNTVRQRLVWLMVNSSVPMRRDKLLLEDMSRSLAFQDPAAAEEFLVFHGLEVIELGTGQKLLQLPARSPKDNKFDVGFDETRQAAFNDRLGQGRMPAKCEFPKRLEGLLHEKFEALPYDRSQIVLGATDPASSEAAPVAEMGSPAPVVSPARPSPLSVEVTPAKPAAATAAASPAQAPKSAAKPSPFAPLVTPKSATQATPPPRRKRRSSAAANVVEIDDDEVLDAAAPKETPLRLAISSAKASVSPGSAPGAPKAAALSSPDEVKAPALSFSMPKAAPPPSSGGLFQFGQALSAPPKPFTTALFSDKTEAKPSMPLPTSNLFTPLTKKSEEPVAVSEEDPKGHSDPLAIPSAEEEEEETRHEEKPKKRKAESKLKMSSWRRTCQPKPGRPFSFTGKVTADDTPRLFRMSLLFRAWRSAMREQRCWSAWAHASVTEASGRPEVLQAARGLLLRRPRPDTVSLGAALREAALRAPLHCSLSAHRLGLLLPEADSETSDLAQLISESFASPSESRQRLGKLQIDGRLGDDPEDLVASVLRTTSAEGPPKVGISVLELRPKPPDSDDSAGSGEGTAGTVSALLVVASNAVPLDSSEDSSWAEEARRAKAILRNMDGSLKVASCQKRPIAVLFAVSMPEVASEEALELASQSAEALTQRVQKDFIAALKEEMEAVEDSQVEAFCVAVAPVPSPASDEEDSDDLPAMSAGCIIVQGGLGRAAAWTIRASSGWAAAVPKVGDLELVERLLGYWAHRSLGGSAGGLMFPQTARQLKADFEDAVDACAADLQRILDELSPEPFEWCTNCDSTPSQQVKAARSLLWSLAPPFEAWHKCRSPVEFWKAVRSFLQAALPPGAAKAPRPPWWQNSCPDMPSAAMRAIVRTQPSYGPGRLLTPQFMLPKATQEISKAAEAPVMSGPDESVALPTKRPLEESERAVNEPELSSNQEAEQPSKKRRLSMSDILRLDRAWSDSVLKSVALLAANVPSGA